MPFDINSAKKAGKKSKWGPAKKGGPSIKEKIEDMPPFKISDLISFTSDDDPVK